jgi:hypothetical protein
LPTRIPQGSVFAVAALAGTGEANTASNIGTGLGLFKQKNSLDLQFKSLLAGSNKVTIASTTNEISVDVNESNLSLNNLSGVVSTTKGGTGLSSLGGGNQILGINNGATGFEYKTIAAGSGININHSANTITFSATSSGENNTASNIGIGSGIFKQKNGVDLQFKSLLSGSNKITISSTTNEVTLNINENNLSVNNLNGIASTTKGGTGLNAIGTANQILGVNTVGNGLQYKTLIAGSGVNISHGANTVTISATVPTSTGEANTASNQGMGLGIFKAKSGVDLQFKSLNTSSNKITLTSSTNQIGIDANEANFNLNNIGGILGVTKGGTGTGTSFDQGAVVFADAGGIYNQNKFLVWNNANKHFGIGTNEPHSTLHVEGSMAHAVLTINSDVALDDTNYIILADSSGGKLTIKLPDAKEAKGRVYTIKALKTAGNPITLQPAGGSIDTMPDLQLTTDYESRQIVSDSVDWWVVNGYKP